MKLPQPRSTVIYRDLPEGAVLFCTKSEVYYSLNPIGARIWQLLPPECASEEDVVARLSEAHPDISPERILADVRGLLEELAGNGLVESSRAA